MNKGITMTIWRFSLLVPFMLCLAVPSFGASSKFGSREHYQMAHDGRLSTLTDIIQVSDDENKSVTLLESEGRGFILSRIQDYRGRKLIVEIRELQRGDFIRATYNMPYKSGNRRQVQEELESLPPSAFVTPLKIETNTHVEELRIDKWKGSEGLAARSHLTSRTNGSLLRDLKALRPVLASTGPAGHAVCRYILGTIEPEGSCRRSPSVSPIPQEINCIFDARFGYPCGPEDN